MESADLKPRKIVLKKSSSITTTSTTTIIISTNDEFRESSSSNGDGRGGDDGASFNEANTQQRESSSNVIANINEKSNSTTPPVAATTQEAHLLLEKKLREKLIEAQRSLNEIEQNKEKNGSSGVGTKHEKETQEKSKSSSKDRNKSATFDLRDKLNSKKKSVSSSLDAKSDKKASSSSNEDKKKDEKRRRSKSKERQSKEHRLDKSNDHSTDKKKVKLDDDDEEKKSAKKKTARSRSRSRSKSKASKTERRRSSSRHRRDESSSKSSKRKSDHTTSSRRKSRSRSRSPTAKRYNSIKESEYYNDKKKLLEIAKTNLSIFLEMQNLAVQNNIKTIEHHEKQQQQMLKPKNDPKSISDFVAYCKELSKAEDQNEPERDMESLVMRDTKPSKFSAGYDDRYAYLNNTSSDGQLALTYPASSAQQAVHTSIKIFPVSSGSKHREVEVERKDEIDTEIFPTSKPETNPENMKIVMYDDPVLKRPDKKSDESLEKTNSIQTGPNFGRFTGGIDVKMLRPEELEGAFKAWTRKDLLTNATPITTGIGKKILEKMGWKQGQGLGKNSEGFAEPIKVDIKLNRKGLVSQNENKTNYESPIVQSCDGKHPVSSLIEICRARRWPEPVYDMVSESGPDHLKTFLMKVKVKDTFYIPDTPSQNKKLAKASAALHCLKVLGVIKA